MTDTAAGRPRRIDACDADQAATLVEAHVRSFDDQVRMDVARRLDHSLAAR